MEWWLNGARTTVAGHFGTTTDVGGAWALADDRAVRARYVVDINAGCFVTSTAAFSCLNRREMRPKYGE